MLSSVKFSAGSVRSTMVGLNIFTHDWVFGAIVVVPWTFLTVDFSSLTGFTVLWLYQLLNTPGTGAMGCVA